MISLKIKKHRQSSDYQCFLPVGVTGFYYQKFSVLSI
nr:MAG TPA: hypothetical protein [Caudoviricetes sp.]